MTTTKKTKTETETPLFLECGRCIGKGHINAYAHYANGVCFDCDGTGGTWTTEEREERLAKRREQDRARRARKAEEKAAKADAARETFLAEHEGLAEALKTEHHIIEDLNETLTRNGELSEKQVALAFRIVEQAAERAAEIAARPMENVPEGRSEVTGEVVSLKWEDNHFSPSPDAPMVCKIVVADERGFRLYGTAPKAIREELAKGDRVTFTATLEPKEAGFGFFKRATKARVL